MKVPTYQSQGVVTSKVGATQFSVQANPSALTAGAAAFTQVAAGAQKESLAWYEQELKAERASKLAAAENEFKIILDNEQILAKTNAQQNPSKALKNYNKVVSNSSKRIAGKIDDGIVKKRFLASAASNVSNKRLSVMQTVRNSAIDIGKAQIITRATQLENIIATGNPAEKSKAQIELFGVEISPGKFVGGLYQNAARTGYFTNVEATNKNLSARGNVARIGVRQQISNAAISGKPGDALVVLQNLSDPKNFPFLKPADRDNLLREANNLVGTLEILPTPAGNILKELFRSGIKLGISSRGMGSVETIDEDDAGKQTVAVQPDFELIAFDFVSNPSTQGAFLHPTNEGVINESVEYRVDERNPNECGQWCKVESRANDINRRMYCRSIRKKCVNNGKIIG